jgi:hypothetical protein
VLVPDCMLGFESRGPSKAPGGDTLVGRAELVGRGEKTHELRRRMGWRESKNENGNVLFGK